MTTDWSPGARTRVEVYVARIREQINAAAEQLADRLVVIADVDRAFQALFTLPEIPDE